MSRVFQAFVKRTQAAPVAHATVDLHPYVLPLLVHPKRISDWETALAVYADALRALRDGGAPDNAMVSFQQHKGMFGDRGNGLVSRIHADWEEAAR